MLKAKHSSLYLPFKCFLKIHTKLTSWCRIVKRELSKSPVFAEYMEWRQVRGAADPRLEFNIHISLYFVPGLLKRKNLKFLFIFSSQTLITCFGSTPWSHGIWFTTGKNAIDHISCTLHSHFLRQLARNMGAESKGNWFADKIDG